MNFIEDDKRWKQIRDIGQIYDYLALDKIKIEVTIHTLPHL